MAKFMLSPATLAIDLKSYIRDAERYLSLPADEQRWEMKPHFTWAENIWKQINSHYTLNDEQLVSEEIWSALLIYKYALPELLKNAYDAGATEWQLILDQNHGVLTLRDNGAKGFKGNTLGIEQGQLIDYSDLSHDGERIQSNKTSDATKFGGAGAGLAQISFVLRSPANQGKLLMGFRQDHKNGAEFQLITKSTASQKLINQQFQLANKQQDRSVAGLTAALTKPLKFGKSLPTGGKQHGFHLSLPGRIKTGTAKQSTLFTKHSVKPKADDGQAEQAASVVTSYH